MWVRIEDSILENPKVLKVGLKGFILYIAGLTFCARSLSDGFIPKAKLYTLAPWLTPHEIVWFSGALVGARLWAKARQRGEHGYRIHDYLDYNPSKAVVLHDRQNTARRVKAHRERWRGNGPSNAVSNTPPVPVPVPMSISEILNPPTPHESGGREARQTPTVEQTRAYLAKLKEGGA